MKTKTPRYKLTNLERRYFSSLLALRYIECTLLDFIYLFLPPPPPPPPPPALYEHISTLRYYQAKGFENVW